MNNIEYETWLLDSNNNTHKCKWCNEASKNKQDSILNTFMEWFNKLPDDIIKDDRLNKLFAQCWLDARTDLIIELSND